jgi:hypothetical protein
MERSDSSIAIQEEQTMQPNQMLMKDHGCSDGSHARLSGARSPSDVTQAMKSPPTHTFWICSI